MGRIAASIEIIKASWALLKKDKELVWLPVFSMLATLVTVALFAGGFMLTTSENATTGELETSWGGYGLAFVLYVVLAIITVFFNAALIFAANERMSGSDPSVESALAGAMSKFGRILPWALVSATVSIIIKSIEERAGIFGRIIGSIVGIAWALVTFLVLPIIVIEDLGVRDAVKRAGNLFKKTWGEQVVGNAAIGLVGLAAVLIAAPFVILAFVSGVTAVIIAAIAVAAIWVLGVSVISAAMSGIFQTALYHYATTGQAPSGFTTQQMDAAFRPRRRLGGSTGTQPA